MSRSGDGDFLGRWSARKLQARAEPAPEPAPSPDAPPVAPQAGEAASEPAAPEKSDAEILQELGLPDPGSMVKGDDFKAFLRAGVPARLRNRALRRLWLSDPVLANLDGLNDYDQDFTDAATVMPALKTAYKVGKGFLRDEAEASSVPAAAEAPPDAAVAEAPAEAAEETAAEEAPEATAASDAAEAPNPEPAAEAHAAPVRVAETPDAAAPRPHRMRFRFDAA